MHKKKWQGQFPGAIIAQKSNINYYINKLKRVEIKNFFHGIIKLIPSSPQKEKN
jgi:hypothetical protein